MRRATFSLFALGLVSSIWSAPEGAAQGGAHQAAATAQKALGKKIREGLKDIAADFWIYDDLEAGYATAKRTGKPLLVSFRCVP